MSERDWLRRGRVKRVAGAGAATTVTVDLARVGLVGPLAVPLSACFDTQDSGQGSSGTVWPTRVRLEDTVVVADVGATPDTELLVIAVLRA